MLRILKRTTIILSTILFILISSYSISAVALNDSLAAYWSFDTDALDSVGGHGGTVDGATKTSAGLISGAYTFDGVNDGIYVAEDATFQSNKPISFCGWAKPNLGTATYFVNNVDTAGYGTALYLQSGTQYYIQTNGGSTHVTLSSGTQTFVAGQWYFLCGTTGTTAIQYWNATANGNDATPASGSYDTNRPFDIGYYRRSSGGSPTYFNGTIDEVSWWSRELSAAEIRTIYQCQSMNYTCAQPPFINTTSADNCTYSGTGNYNINCNSFCNITTNYNLSLNNINITGSGYVNITSWLRNYTMFDMRNSTNCAVSLKSGGRL